MAQVKRIRGSLTDVITLESFVFDYEPKVADKARTGYARQEVFGQRLANVFWIGQGASAVDLEIFLLGSVDTLSQIEAFKALLEPQDDIGAPHPLYINVGGMYVGKQYVLCDVEVRPTVFTYSNDMSPQEAFMSLKLEEIPIGNYAGIGV